MIMSDMDDRVLNEDRERQRRFLEEAFGLSDDEIERLLDALVRYRKDTEDHLKKDDFEEETVQKSENDEPEHLARLNQNTPTPVDIYEISGEKFVPLKHFNETLERHNQTIDTINKMLSNIKEGVERANSDSSKQYYSDETWQAVEDLKPD